MDAIENLGYEKEYRRKWKENNPREYEDMPDYPIYNLNGLIGKNYPVSNSIKIEFTKHYNGSGPKGFGGSKDWPHLTIEID